MQRLDGAPAGIWRRKGFRFILKSLASSPLPHRRRGVPIRTDHPWRKLGRALQRHNPGYAAVASRASCRQPSDTLPAYVFRGLDAPPLHTVAPPLAAAGLIGLSAAGCVIGEEFRHGYIIDDAAVAQVRRAPAPSRCSSSSARPPPSPRRQQVLVHISQNTRARDVHRERPKDQRVWRCTSTPASRSSAWRSTASRTARCSTSSPAPRDQRRRAGLPRPADARPDQVRAVRQRAVRGRLTADPG